MLHTFGVSPVWRTTVCRILSSFAPVSIVVGPSIDAERDQAGVARRLFVDAAAEQASFEDRVSSLTEANALLSQLTSVALTLPSSLDLGDTVTAAMGHLGQLFDFTGAAVLVLDAATGTWRAEGAAGLPCPAPMTTSQLPPPLLQLALRNGSRAPAGGAVAALHLDPEDGRRGLWRGESGRRARCADGRANLWMPAVDEKNYNSREKHAAKINRSGHWSSHSFFEDAADPEKLGGNQRHEACGEDQEI